MSLAHLVVPKSKDTCTKKIIIKILRGVSLDTGQEPISKNSQCPNVEHFEPYKIVLIMNNYP